MVTEATLISKGSLNDLIQVIEIEESPLLQADLLEIGKGKN